MTLIVLGTVPTGEKEKPAPAPPPTFSLDIGATPVQEIPLTVPAPSTLAFKIIRTGAPIESGFAIDVGEFTNAEGVVVPVSISVGNDPDTGLLHVAPGAFTESVLPVNLHVKSFPAPGKYNGQFIVSTAGANAKPTVWRFILKSANELRPATLVLDQNAATVTLIKPLIKRFCLWGDAYCMGESDGPVDINVRARDKSGNWPLKGVTARLEAGLKTPDTGYDAVSNLVVRINNKPAKEFRLTGTSPNGPCPCTDTNVSDDYVIPVSEQGLVGLSFTATETGEYTIPLRFTAANSSDDDQQKLVVTVQVRRGWGPAVLVLLGAVLFSFLATRFVSMLRQRAALLTRLRALQPAWLPDEQPILPVIWLQATRSLADQLSRKFWLAGANGIDARVTKATAMLTSLERMRRVRDQINNIPEEMPRLRATWKLNDALAELSDASLTDQDIVDFGKRLDDLVRWWGPEKAATYERNLELSISKINADTSIGDPKRRAVAGELERNIRRLMDRASKSDSVGQRLAILKMADADHQRLAILVELCSNKPDIGIKPDYAGAPLKVVRDLVDDAWWELLKNKDTKRTIESPTSTLDPPEAYQTIKFRVNTPAQPFLIKSYLMQNKLTYAWTITLFERKLFGRPQAIGIPLQVVSSQPQIVQYAPKASIMQASVEIFYAGDPGPCIEGKPVNVVGSREFGIFAKYEMADWISVGLAAIISVVSGLSLYVLKPTFFGSLQDYITLFTWGAGIDQTKNFIQSVGAYAATSGKPASPAGT